MTKYREIIRLTGLGFSQRNIMASCGVAQKTVVKVQKRQFMAITGIKGPGQNLTVPIAGS